MVKYKIKLLNVTNTSIFLGLENGPFFSFDLEGRWFWAFFDNFTFRRGLNNDILKIEKKDDFSKSQWKRLNEDEVDHLNHSFYSLFYNLFSKYRHPVSKKILNYTPQKLQQQKKFFTQIYNKVGILPPDHYFSVVVQLTEGCSWNRCVFCNFYQNQNYKVKSIYEFEDHLNKIIKFFGNGITYRTNVFIGEANPFGAPKQIFIDSLKMINKFFPIGKNNFLKGIYSFIEPSTTTFTDFRQLKDLNIKRLYFGLETGCNSLRKLLNKPGDVSDTIELANIVKKSKINLGLIIMLGIGGKKFFSKHTKETIQTLKKILLDENDIIFFSPLVIHKKIDTIDEMDMKKQMEIIHNEFKHIKKAIYDIRGFIY